MVPLFTIPEGLLSITGLDGALSETPEKLYVVAFLLTVKLLEKVDVFPELSVAIIL